TPFGVENSFLALALLSQYVLFEQIYLERMRAAQPHLNREELAEIFILCPSTDEQRHISEHVRHQSKKINTAIQIKQQQIEKLNEYKTTLINAAVTGKIKVTPG
ncbi:MAG: hypothetical protein Q9N68_00865, partial [Gammaproteobacteria bacterium]|nr:hypothetical protein [Gammaproteobacteria bacterium]